nr:hypothetical protein [Erythrocladia irregularis]
MHELDRLHFLRVKHKISKVIYYELSTRKKIFVYMLLTLFCPQNHAPMITYYCLFLFLIWAKTKSTNFISYNTTSNKIILIKIISFFCLLLIRNPMNTKQNIITDYINSSETNNFVSFFDNQKKINPAKFSQTLSIIYTECLKSIYRIEVYSIISIFTTQILLQSIHPKNIINNSKTNLHINTELQLIFTLSLQITYLITNQFEKLRTAIALRESTKNKKEISNLYEIIVFIYFYYLRSKKRIKQHTFNAAQLNKSIDQHNKYYEFKNAFVLIQIETVLMFYILILIILATLI